MGLHMDHEVSATIAGKLKEAVAALEETVEYMREHVEFGERAPLVRAIVDIYALLGDEIFARLVRANPALHEVLFRGLPPEYAESRLRYSRYPVQPKPTEGE